MARMSDLVLAGIDYADVSGEECAGDDPFEVGAAIPLMRRQSGPAISLADQAASFSRRGAAVNAARAQAVQNAALAQNMPAVILPVDTVANVAAGAAFTVNVVPVSRVRLTRFTVSPAIAGSFILTSVLAGRVNMFVGAGAIPADVFAPNNFGPPLEVPMIEAGTILQVNGTNVSGAAARFIGAFSAIDLTLKLRSQG